MYRADDSSLAGHTSEPDPRASRSPSSGLVEIAPIPLSKIKTIVRRSRGAPLAIVKGG